MNSLASIIATSGELGAQITASLIIEMGCQFKTYHTTLTIIIQIPDGTPGTGIHHRAYLIHQLPYVKILFPH
ncbi:unknown [Prevotella sp. CAG:924]|nr:unknown [Prevotella sp. CAG:924]